MVATSRAVGVWIQVLILAPEKQGGEKNHCDRACFLRYSLAKNNKALSQCVFINSYRKCIRFKLALLIIL